MRANGSVYTESGDRYNNRRTRETAQKVSTGHGKTIHADVIVCKLWEV